MPTPSSPRLDAIEATLAELIPRLSPAPNPRGRPEILPGALLWTAMLVCIVRKTGSQQAIWRLLTQAGLWDFPRVPVTAEAVRIRLERSGPVVMQTLFTQVTDALAVQMPGDAALAPFASGVYAIDDSTLDTVARTLPALRTVPAGDDRLVPGKLITAFDVRTQQFQTVLTTEVPRQNEKVAARDVVATLPKRGLILADLGYFSFAWFDDLSDAAYRYISKLRTATSTTSAHVLSVLGTVRDELVWLGTWMRRIRPRTWSGASRCRSAPRSTSISSMCSTRTKCRSWRSCGCMPDAGISSWPSRRSNGTGLAPALAGEMGADPDPDLGRAADRPDRIVVARPDCHAGRRRPV